MERITRITGDPGKAIDLILKEPATISRIFVKIEDGDKIVLEYTSAKEEEE